MTAAGREAMNERTCIVTRASGTPDDMIRFVVDPENNVVPDLKRKLPGRGCWVTAERRFVERAVAKKMFARALKTEARASSELADEVDRLLSQSLLGMMAMARKAGRFATGATKVDSAVRSGDAVAVFHATDAAADGVRKIDQARRAVAHLGGPDIPAFRLFDADAMAAYLGDGALIHAAALAGQAGEGVVKRAMMLQRYRTGSSGDQSAAE